MPEKLRINPGSITAPRAGDDPVGYAVWLLTEHPEIYRQFRSLCDQYLAVRPDAVISARMVCQVIRWNTAIKATGDVFKINNNATPLLSRLYVLERPSKKFAFRTRKSVYDDVENMPTVMEAWQNAR